MNRFIEVFKIKDLRKKILIVAGILIFYRLLAAIPIPKVDIIKLQDFFSQNQIFGFLNLLSGGGLSNLSIVMLGVGPYITATIIMQLLTIVFPRIKEIYYEQGAQGQAKFNQYARLLTVPLAALQAYGFLALLSSQGVIDKPVGFDAIINVVVIVTGSIIALWFGELISEQKIGNGISLIILAGILSSLPNAVRSAILVYDSSNLFSYIIFIAIFILIILGVVYLNEGERKVPVIYAKRVRGMKMYGGAQSYLPLKVNQAGMIPLIFAISVMLFPQFIAQTTMIFSRDLGMKLNDLVNSFLANQLLYGIVYFILVFIFTYFYSAITFNPEEISKNLQRAGGFIPGIRPGGNTTQFFKKLMNKTTFFGALFLGIVAVLPLIIEKITGISALHISGTSLLIVVAVILDLVRQINSQFTIREYSY
ncbi:MAG: preprotein translocase subunit SecY [Patescibacteria group bacterium]|nr:preprotein translocase subunit SecY [Patescibacteria group bacterium]MDW8279565.1 preprotein translocase subunit SecY [bacterium]